MKNEHGGVYVTIKWTLIISAVCGLLVLKKESLVILNDKLIVNIKNKRIELAKSQISEVRNYWNFNWGAIRIIHSNPNLPELLVFSPNWPFGLRKDLKEKGYPAQMGSNR